jgi:hypothetical protein
VRIPNGGRESGVGQTAIPGRGEPADCRGGFGSEQKAGIEAGRRPVGLDEVAQDLANLGRIGDDGYKLHLGSTTGADQRIYLVHLCDQPGLCGAADARRDGERLGWSGLRRRLSDSGVSPCRWGEACDMGQVWPTSFVKRHPDLTPLLHADLSATGGLWSPDRFFSFRRWLSPRMVMMWLWCSSRSRIAVATTGSPKTSLHSPTLLSPVSKRLPRS